jgi:hypothetical protein
MRLRPVLACLAVLALLSAPSVSLAQGGGGSAGDQQYTDPLAGTTTPSQTATQPASSTPASTTPAPSTSTTPAPTSSGASSTSAPVTSTPSSAPTSDPTEPTATTAAGTTGAGKTLPFTGLNLWAVVGIGLTLTASGLLIRIRARA